MKTVKGQHFEHVHTHCVSAIMVSCCAACIALKSSKHNTTTCLQGKTVPKIGAWADLQTQLQRRRAELGGQATQKPTTSSTSAAQQANAKSHKAMTASGADSIMQTVGAVGRHVDSSGLVADVKLGNAVGAVTGERGAVRPRGGVRSSAMGPLLNFLRNSGGLTS